MMVCMFEFSSMELSIHLKINKISYLPNSLSVDLEYSDIKFESSRRYGAKRHVKLRKVTSFTSLIAVHVVDILV